MSPSRLGAAGLVALVLAGTLASASALAYFTAPGTGNAAADVARLEQPSIAGAVTSPGGTVALTWKTVTPPGLGTVTYTVSRDGEGAGGTCTAMLVLTACVDTGLTVGVHQYVVTARWRSWTTAGAPAEVEVEAELEPEVGPPDHLVLSAATITPTAGEGDELTIVAADAAGNTATEYTGTHKLTFSDAPSGPEGDKPTVARNSGSAIAFGRSTPLNFESGVATVEGSKNGVMTLYASGETAIEASDGTISTAAPLTVNVKSAEASKLTLEAETTTPVAGEADDLKIVAEDEYGNAAASYAGSRELVFNGASASPGGDLPTVSDAGGSDVAFGVATPIAFEAGVASASSGANGTMKLYGSGSATVEVSDGSLSDRLATTTSAGATSAFQLEASTTTTSPGEADKLTIVAQDGYGNTTTAYAGDHELIFSGAPASPDGTLPTVADNSRAAIAFGGATTIRFRSGVAAATSKKNGTMKLYGAGPAGVSVTDGTASTPVPLELIVAAGAASRLGLTDVSASAGTLEPGCLFACALTGLGNQGTVSARVAVADDYGNTVSDLGGGHAVKATTDGDGSIGGSPLAIPSAGAAETATQFTFTAKSSGGFTETVTAATSAGTAYTSATLTASR